MSWKKSPPVPVGIGIAMMWGLLSLGIGICKSVEFWMIAATITGVTSAVVATTLIVKRKILGIYIGGVLVYVNVGILLVIKTGEFETSELQLIRTVVPILVATLVSLIWTRLMKMKISKKHFNMMCPKCKSVRTKNLGFAMKKLECKECGEVWER